METMIPPPERHPVSIASVRFVANQTGVSEPEALRALLFGVNLEQLGIMRASQIFFTFGSIAPQEVLNRLLSNGDGATLIEEFLQ